MTKAIIDCGEFGTFGISNVEKLKRDGDTFTVFYFFADGEAVNTPFVASRITTVAIVEDSNGTA